MSKVPATNQQPVPVNPPKVDATQANLVDPNKKNTTNLPTAQPQQWPQQQPASGSSAQPQQQQINGNNLPAVQSNASIPSNQLPSKNLPAVTGTGNTAPTVAAAAAVTASAGAAQGATTQNGQSEHNSDCDRCRRINSQSEEQTKASDKLRANNEDLKGKIQMLQAVLSEKMEALKQKKPVPAAKRERSQDPLRKELDEEHKKLEQVQRSVKTLEEKQQGNQNVQRVVEMKNIIQDKQNQLSKLRKDNKLLEDIKLHNQALLDQRDEFQEIKDLEEEVIGLKALLRDIRKTDRQVEKDMTKQCQYLIAIEQKHKEVCEKFGISPSLNQTRFDNLQDLIAENLRNKQIRQKREENKKVEKNGKIEVTEEAYKQILEELKKQKAEKAELEALQKKESDEIQTKVRQANYERDSLLLRLRDKDKELNIAIMKINELKRLTKHNALQPLNVVDSAMPGRTEFAVVPRKRKDIRREQRGVAIGSETACSWDNSEELPEEKDYTITEVRVSFRDEQIKGITIEYKLRSGERIEQECFASENVEDLETRVLKLRGPETIVSVSGYYNNFFIEYLRIVSSRGNYILAGTDRNQARCKKFECEIKKDERPIAFFGIVDRINLKKQQDASEQPVDMVLTSIGIVLKKKDSITTSRSTQLGGSAQAKTSNQNLHDDEEENELYSSDLKRENQYVSNKIQQKRKVIDALSQKNLDEDLLQNYYSRESQ